MTVRYEYKSACCGHDYVEQRAADESAFVTTCNKCGQAEYELVNETVIADEVERVAALEIPAE
jgi:hypothetical protein